MAHVRTLEEVITETQKAEVCKHIVWTPILENWLCARTDGELHDFYTAVDSFNESIQDTLEDHSIEEFPLWPSVLFTFGSGGTSIPLGIYIIGEHVLPQLEYIDKNTLPKTWCENAMKYVENVTFVPLKEELLNEHPHTVSHYLKDFSRWYKTGVTSVITGDGLPTKPTVVNFN